ncbi:MAG: pyridoxal phosphate-dependent aminotransferase [Candidatus Aenigmarchaeota archaeon]|nr:pyridoxal phosphate-dependent aminotransferase [Candidatus Aenigmarchaeota archaeon]
MPKDKLKSIKFSVIAQINEIANSMGSDLIRLEMGDVDFTTPDPISKEAFNAAKQNFTHYTPFNGFPVLREAIAEKLENENNITIDKNNVLVTTGASSAVFIAFYGLSNDNDEAIIHEPFWSNFQGMATLAGVKLKPVATEEKNGFKIDLNALENSITKDTKMLILNSPNNPTGAVFGKKLLEQTAEVAEKHGLIIISDEEYEKFIYDGKKHFSIGSIYDDTVTVQSFSKTYAMCGWRVGYMCAKKEIIDEMAKVNLFTNICCSSISQRVALKAMKSDQNFTKNMVKEFETRRDLFVKKLNKIDGIRCAYPEGSLYVWPNVSGLNSNSFNVSKFLIEKAKVSVVPGNAFGDSGEGYLRISLGASREKLEEAASRMKDALETFK